MVPMNWGAGEAAFQITIETFNRQMRFIKIRKIVHTRKINTILILLGRSIEWQTIAMAKSVARFQFLFLCFLLCLFFFFLFLLVHSICLLVCVYLHIACDRKSFYSFLPVFVRNCMRFPLEVLSIHTGWLANGCRFRCSLYHKISTSKCCAERAKKNNTRRYIIV